jgi:plastocyanin
VISARDYLFEAKGLRVGENLVRFSNKGEQWHHVVAHPLGAGSIDEITGYFQQESPPGPPPIPENESAPYSNVIDGGSEQNLEMTFAEPGRYALLCFIADRDGGPPHVALGMAREIEVE